MTREPLSFLVVDDDDTFRERLARALRKRGHVVWVASTGAEALALARVEAPDRAVVDLRMEGLHGLEVLKALKALDPTIQVVLLTGYGSIATAVDAMRLGAHHYVAKPADADDVLAAFERGSAEPLVASPTYDAPSLARAEWEHINRVLADTGGNVSETARRLRVHRRSLQRKLQKHPPRG